ncbi:MAG: T9SS type A sorting domain-containing protein [Bacteroidia bacterium]
MKKITLLTFLLAAFTSHAATFTSLSTGSFHNSGTWNVVGIDADGIPDSDDDVIISAGHTVTQATTGVMRSMLINASGVFANANFPVYVHGNFTHNGNMTGLGGIYFQAVGTMSGTLPISAGGNWIFYVNYTIAPGVVVNKNNYITIAANRTLTNNGNITLWGGSITMYAGSVFVNAANASMRVANNVSTAGTIDASAVPNTFTYYLNTYNNIKATNATYYNLNINAASTHNKYISNPLTVLGNLTINTGAVLNGNGNDIFVGGNWTNNANTNIQNVPTVEFNGSDLQVISRTGGSEIFNNVNLSNFNDTIRLMRDVIANGTTTINFCVLDPNGFVYRQRGAQWNGQGGNTTITGNVSFEGTVAQTMGGTIFTDWGNVEVNNANGVTNGAFNRCHGTLTLTLGNFSSASQEFTFLSSAAETGRLGTITGGSLSGTAFVCQRFISAAPPNTTTPYWSYFSSPVISATLTDWDNEMYMSGVGGADGNACCPIFFSVRTMSGSVTTNVTSVSTTLAQGIGYQTWLADDMTMFNGLSIDTRGRPTTGPVTSTCPAGFTLIGNPYMSQVLFSNLNRSNVNNFFYILDESISNYAFWDGGSNTGTGKLSGSGGVINSTQGFLVEATGSGSVTFDETDKTSNTTTFVRMPASNNVVNVRLSRLDGQPFGAENIIAFSDQSTDDRDGFDLPAIQSPSEFAPYMRTLSADDQALFYNGRNQLAESQSVPLLVTPNTVGQFKLNFGGLNLFAAYSCVYLEDLENGTFVNLKQHPDYVFEVSDSQAEKRFVVHFDQLIRLADGSSACPFEQRLGSTNEADAPKIYALSPNVVIEFNYTDLTEVQVALVDLLGREVYVSTMNVSSERIQLPMPEVEGVYIVRIQQGDKIHSQKVTR